MVIFSILLCALLLDKLAGEPRKYHPLVYFGNLSNFLENRFNRNSSHCKKNNISKKMAGSFCVLLLLTVFVVPTYWLNSIAFDHLYFALNVLLLYFCIGWNSLIKHSSTVASSLKVNDIESARQRVGQIVSRETAELDQQGIAVAAIESTLENGNDAVFAPIFWFLIGGIPAALAYRLINTLDAMWGYKNERFRDFGWAAARLDDIVNFLPARLCALSYILAGHKKSALHCLLTQTGVYTSPNGNPVMTSGAGALQVKLGGPVRYFGVDKIRPIAGTGQSPESIDIDRACQLVSRALLLWLCVVGIGAGVFYE